MATTIDELAESNAPSAAETQLAEESSQRLTKLLGSRKKNIRFHIQRDDKPEVTIGIPEAALRLLADILSEMGRGNDVTLLPIQSELTTQQAADLLNVSRPFLIELLENGAIPHRKVGTHRRVQIRDLMEFKRKNDEARLKALEELSELDQELGLMGR